ncbi:MAG: HAD-IB family phosphatase [Candidatus Altiarchaeales archaeon]|nr:HAD-IB family phosphatase [Candidatus Altiarchaeales archaeon]
MTTKYKLAVFDVNIVLIKSHSITDLADIIGTKPQVERYIQGHTSGLLSMSQALEEACKHLKGLKRSQAIEHARNMEIMDGAQEMVKALRKENITLGIITTGFTLTMNILNQRLGHAFKYVICNDLVFKDNVATGEIRFSVRENEMKAEILRDLAKKEGVDMSQTIAVGDSMGDQNMLDAAGLGIAFNPNEALINYASKHGIALVKKPDLRGIIPLIVS